MVSACTHDIQGKPLINKVNFVVVGAQKAGTTALRQFLGQHPEIGLVRTRGETHFFDKYGEDAARGDYTQYHAMYSDCDLALCCGDVTPIYLYKRGCLDHIRAYNPAMKVIVMVRDPVERAYSQWAMETSRGSESRRFVTALFHELYFWLRHGQHPVYSYVQRGFYGAQIARLFEVFPQGQCLILLNSDLKDNHNAVLRRIYEFLDIEVINPPAAEIVHSRTYNPLSVVWRRLLRLVYYRDTRRLERLTGLKCQKWYR